MITGNKGTAQLPMKERAENVMKELVRYNGSLRRDSIDKKVVDYLLKKGLVKIGRSDRGRSSRTTVQIVNMPNLKKEEERVPYKKRKEAMAELKEKRKEPKLKAKEKLQKKIEEASEFYYFMKGQYYFSEKYPVSVEKHATHIYGVTKNDKVFYAKPPANKKKKPKLTKSELTWLRIKSK